jgi:hypothetical protein
LYRATNIALFLGFVNVNPRLCYNKTKSFTLSYGGKTFVE